jgi:hypothetical protein
MRSSALDLPNIVAHLNTIAPTFHCVRHAKHDMDPKDDSSEPLSSDFPPHFGRGSTRDTRTTARTTARCP